MNKTITLYRGSNLGTVSHELIHFRQLQERGLFGRAYPPELEAELEAEVRIVLQQWGFVQVSVLTIDTEQSRGYPLRVPRKLHIKYPSAIIHVLNRGDHENIFKDDEHHYPCFNSED